MFEYVIAMAWNKPAATGAIVAQKPEHQTERVKKLEGSFGADSTIHGSTDLGLPVYAELVEKVEPRSLDDTGFFDYRNGGC